MAADEREEAGDEQRAPDPDDGDDEPGREEGFAEDVLGRVHGQRPEHPMTQESSDAPVRGDAGPALQMGLRARVSRRDLVQLFLNDRVDNVVIAVADAVGRAEGEFLLAEIGPVEVLRAEEREQERVRDRAEGGGDGAVDAGQDLPARGYGHAAVHGVGGPEPYGESRGHAEERGGDGCDGALAAPEDGEGCWEDPWTGEYS